ncbi:MAG: NAD(P)/FAD-dependent oxidoreductase [Clostridiales bacterium]|nr:NAD(P)/FAD-dependent oxidoreductase [Clostridiales bacterium]
MYDVIIVGCGVTGAATAFTLSRYRLSVLVLEKENDIAMGATRANSAIIHAGYDPEPGTLMARLNVKGCEMAQELCGRLDVPYKNCGSLVLAFDEKDIETLHVLYERGVKNGVKQLEIISGARLREIEPNVSQSAAAALYAPTSGIVNPWEYALAMAEVAALNGVRFLLSHPVTSISKHDGCFTVSCGSEQFDARYVINAAGVDSAVVHEMVAEKAFAITPSRGDYFLLDKSEGSRAMHTLFQCPGPAGKGVLVSPTVHGNLLVGPNAVSCSDAHRVNTTADGLAFVKQHALKSVPSVNFRDTIRSFAGMRANSDQNDFIIGFPVPRFLDLAGIKSPGLTCAPATGEYAAELLEKNGLELIPKESPVTSRRKIRFKELSIAEKQRLIAEDPLYGRVICRCETVTEGEIVEACHSPIPPVSVDGIKRRAGTGMGRCQGGFCGPRVLEILCRERGISPLDALKDGEGSFILFGETKAGGRT